MDTQKNIFILFGEWLQARQARRREAAAQAHPPRGLTGWLPSRGNVIFTLAMIALLVLAQSVGALPLGRPHAAPDAASTGTIAYQGRLADADGRPLTGTYPMIFRLYTVATGGTPLWSEQWTGSNGVRVSDGLFNVMLGSLTTLPQSAIAGRSQLFLGITVGTDDEMAPRVQLGSVPFAVQALTVPDGSVTTAKIADRAVTAAKLNLIDGNVGIGTANPQAKLDVQGGLEVGNGNLYINSTDTDNFRIRTHTDTPNPSFALGIGNGSGSTSHEPIVWNGMLIFNGTGNSWCPSCGIPVGPNARADVVITSAGNVGIATTSPGAKLDVNGNFHAAGTKSAVVMAGQFGQRLLYAAESPEVRFFDEGLARLQNGVARVELDPVFLETIEGEYLVHVTPYGDAGLYVAEIGHDYFVVKAREGDPNVAFAWRLSAVRKGYSGVRLEEVKSTDHETAK